jgi:hypothetical protein
MIHADTADPHRARASEGEEAGIVHDAAHGGAQHAAAQEHGEATDGTDGDGEDERLVDADVDAGDGEGLRRQVGRQGSGGRPVDGGDQPLDRGEQTDGGDDPGGHRGGGQGAGQQLEQQPDGRTAHEHDEDPRQGPGQPPLVAELEEEVRAAGREGTVSEVEHARRLVGEDQPGCGQPVDGSAHQAGDEEREDVAHAAASGRHTPHGVRCPRSARTETSGLLATSAQSGRWNRVMAGAATNEVARNGRERGRGTAAGAR